MKKIYLFLVVAFFATVACKKSNDTPQTVALSVKVTSATVSSNVMSVNITIAGTLHSQYDHMNLVIYKTDIGGDDWHYPITVKDGDQIVTCNHYSDSSPMHYQIEYLNQGNATFSGMMTIDY